MILVSRPMQSNLCALLPRQDVQPNGEHRTRRSTAPETHMLTRALHSPFTDCSTGTVIQLGGNYELMFGFPGYVEYA
ncbi:hypothetical protein TNCV_4695701 [Trichonephila clavipes]|nr:hypothetical protein TNCV_4695701 [Trichonephila clavipes]